MRGKELLDKMELVDPAYVEAADKKTARQKHHWGKWAVVAACLCLVIAAIPFFALESSTPQDGINIEGGGPPHLVIEGRKYIISPHLSVSNE